MEEEERSVICIKVAVKGKESDESIPKGVLYMTKSRVPRTEPWEHQ